MSQFANTTAHANLEGTIMLNAYSDAELKKLTAITHGTQYTGNTDLDLVYTKHVYRANAANRLNLVGEDGVLKLFNQSKFIPKTAELAIANFWNFLAGEEVVRFVESTQLSDEVIHDVAGDTGILASQTYNGNGIEVYPDSWHIDDLTKDQQENWHIAALIHEIGHGLGMPHLGGGNDGANAGVAGKFGSEVMAPWNVLDNPSGVKSTLIDAAALAIAGLTWRNPRKLAQWVFDDKNKNASVVYNQRMTSSSIPLMPMPTLFNVEKLKAWATNKQFTLKADYFDNLIYLGLQSGIVTLSLAGPMNQDIGEGDVVIANTKAIKGFPLPQVIVRSTVVDVTKPESQNGVMGSIRWSPNGDILLNFNKPYQSTNKHYFETGLTAVTNLTPDF